MDLLRQFHLHKSTEVALLSLRSSSSSRSSLKPTFFWLAVAWTASVCVGLGAEVFPLSVTSYKANSRTEWSRLKPELLHTLTFIWIWPCLIEQLEENKRHRHRRAISRKQQLWDVSKRLHVVTVQNKSALQPHVGFYVEVRFDRWPVMTTRQVPTFTTD